MNIEINDYLEQLKKHKYELLTIVPKFKPQYGNKHKHQALREIAEHSSTFEIEIHPNIIDELIQRERLDRANAFVKSKLATLSASSLAELQLEVQSIMVQQEIEAVEAKIASEAPIVNEEVVNHIKPIAAEVSKKGKKK